MALQRFHRAEKYDIALFHEMLLKKKESLEFNMNLKFILHVFLERKRKW